MRKAPAVAGAHTTGGTALAGRTLSNSNREKKRMQQTGLQTVDAAPVHHRTIDDVIEQTRHIHALLESVMQEGEHYGVIPGTQKPTLYQAGAEKICVLFRVRPEYDVTRYNLDGGHREYEVTCRLVHIPTGNPVGEGVGNCSTMESRYRYRNQAVDTGERIPDDYRENKSRYRAEGYGAKKINGEWKWVRYESGENPDIADVYNTVLKMARKRALVDATKTAFATSDIFTQDAEDLKPYGDGVTVTVEPEQPESPPQRNPDNSGRQTLINQLVEILSHECFLEEDREEFKRLVRQVPTSDLWGMINRYKAELESRLAHCAAEEVDDKLVDEVASEEADREIRGDAEEDIF